MEVLFATIILGVGFIMVAAVFPVALQQTRDTAEAASQMGVARGAANLIAGVASDNTNPNVVQPCNDPYKLPRHNYDSLNTTVLPTYGKRYWVDQSTYPTSRPTFETIDFLPEYKYHSQRNTAPTADAASPQFGTWDAGTALDATDYLYNPNTTWITKATITSASTNASLFVRAANPYLNGQESNPQAAYLSPPVATNANELYLLCGDNVYAGSTSPVRSLDSLIRRNQIWPEDPRAAFEVLYARNGYYNDKSTWGNEAKLVIVPVQARATPIFTAAKSAVTLASDIEKPVTSASPDFYNLRPHPVRFATLHNINNGTLGLNGVDLIVFDNTVRSTPDFVDYEARSINGPTGTTADGAAIEGACVVVRMDNIVIVNGTANTTADDIGRYNGHVFKLGPRRADLDNQIQNLQQAYQIVTGGTVSSFTASINNNLRSGVVYELDPTTPMVTDAGADGTLRTADDIVALGVNTGNVTFGFADAQSSYNYYGLASGWLIGRGYTDPTDPTKGYSGGCMAGTAYSTSVRITPSN